MRDAISERYAYCHKYLCTKCGKLFFSKYKRNGENKFCSANCYSDFRTEQAENRNGLPGWAVDVFTTTRKRADKKNINFDLTYADLSCLIARSGGRCEVTGSPFDISTQANGERRPWFPSIDRIDCSIGYTKENTRIVCVASNLAMNRWGEQVLLEMAVHMLKDIIPHSYRGRKVRMSIDGKQKSFDTLVEAVSDFLKWKKSCDQS